LSIKVNTQAAEMFSEVANQMKTNECITEQLKAENQLEWVRHMNNIRQRATEIANNELIYVKTKSRLKCETMIF
jgi:hypothetical protein